MAAHGVSGQSSITLSLETGRIFAFQDLFRPGADYRAAIDRILLAQIAAQGIPMLKPFAGVDPDTDYYLTADSLVIHYQPYVYTPGVYGVLEFVIPFRGKRTRPGGRRPVFMIWVWTCGPEIPGPPFGRK